MMFCNQAVVENSIVYIVLYAGFELRLVLAKDAYTWNLLDVVRLIRVVRIVVTLKRMHCRDSLFVDCARDVVNPAAQLWSHVLEVVESWQPNTRQLRV